MSQIPQTKKKGSPLSANKTFESNVRREDVSFANVVSGTVPTPVAKLTEKTNENSNNKVFQGIQLIESNNSDPVQVIEQRQLVEQKQKQKRQKVPGMVHASDSRPQTTRGWHGKEETKPLMTGYSVHRNNQGVVLCKY
ncbi:tubby-related protein 3 [Trichonephila clavipes]|nr:tubby-related protein 3 [Trichonephila clavipes]